jgi:hypothetical protein
MILGYEVPTFLWAGKGKASERRYSLISKVKLSRYRHAADKGKMSIAPTYS